MCRVGSYIGETELRPLIGISGVQIYVSPYATHDRQGYESQTGKVVLSISLDAKY